MENKVFITGADRGLGLNLAKLFLEKGYTVFAGRYLRKWGLLEDLKKQYEDKLIIVELDVGSDESVKQAAEFVKGNTESLDILINVAAILGKNEGTIFDKLDYKDMLQCYNITALGALRVTEAFIALIMKGYNKLIVNISSEAGSIGTCWRYDGFGYCMAKAALNMQSAIIHNSLHREFNGQVIDIHPGGMRSNLMNTKGPDTPVSEPPEGMFLTAEYSAGRIIELILDQERFKSDHPAFVNYCGDKIPW